MDLSALKIEPMGYDKLLTLGLAVFFMILMLVTSFLSRRVFLLASGFGAFGQGVYLMVWPNIPLTDAAKLIDVSIPYASVIYSPCTCRYEHVQLVFVVQWFVRSVGQSFMRTLPAFNCFDHMFQTVMYTA